MQVEPKLASRASKSSTATSPSPLMSAAHSADSTDWPLTTANVAIIIASVFIIPYVAALVRTASGSGNLAGYSDGKHRVLFPNDPIARSINATPKCGRVFAVEREISGGGLVRARLRKNRGTTRS